MKFDTKIAWAITIIAVCTFVIYGKSLNYGLTNWDDQVYVSESQLIKNISRELITTPVAANYHPLTMLSLALNYKYSELKPFSYHMVNLLLHILNSLLVFYLIYRITDKKVEIAFITGLLFAIHPMHVESVAWIAARKDVLYSFFFLSALITYHTYLQERRTGSWFLTALLFILSLASKPAAVVFPLVLFALDIYLGRKVDRKVIFEKIPFLLLSLAAGIITLSAQGEAGALAENPVFTLTQKILFASHSLLWYLYNSVVPGGLSAFHPYPSLKDLPAMFYLAPLIVLVISGGIYYYFRNNRVIVFGSLFFFINLVMVLQLLSFGNAIMAERYTYLPYIGLFFIIGSGYSYVMHNKDKKIAKWKNVCIAILLVFSSAISYAAHKRTAIWENSETLWSNVVEVYPMQSTGWYNLGHYFSEKAQYEKSIPAFSKVIEILANSFEAHYNRAQAYRLTGKHTEAIADYTRAAEIKPEEVTSYRGRGTSYFSLQQYQKALEDFQKAVEVAPGDYNAWFGRGNAYFYLKEFSKALEDYTKTLELNPSYPDCFYNRAIAYGNLGDKKRSKEDLIRSEQLGWPRDTVMLKWVNQ